MPSSSPSPCPLIEVIGSLNVDLVTTTPRMPGPGETLTASFFVVGFGGKGANQAVACARLARPRAGSEPADGLKVRMVGAVGDDQFGKDFLAHLEKEGLSTDEVTARPHETTGTAVILVESASGENRILITPGANGTVLPQDWNVRDHAAAVAVFQLEIPLQTVLECIAAARQANRIVVFNPAPAVVLPDSVYKNVHHLILNETEASILSDIPETQLNASLDKAADHFMTLGVQVVIITLGSKGVFWKQRQEGVKQNEGTLVPAHKVTAIDTTAAGDTFVGAYAVHVARHGHKDVQGAVQFANSAASKSVQKHGAQSSIPFEGELL